MCLNGKGPGCDTDMRLQLSTVRILHLQVERAALTIFFLLFQQYFRGNRQNTNVDKCESIEHRIEYQ